MCTSEIVDSDELDEFERLLDASSLRHGTPDLSVPDSPAELVRRVVDRAEALARARYAVGIELLPGRMTGVLVDERGARLAENQLVLNDVSVPAVVAAAASLVDALLPAVPGGCATEERVAVGFQLGAPVDTDTGTVLFFHKTPPGTPEEHGIRWADRQPLGRLVENATGLPTVVENDSNTYAVYQRWFGAGREVSRFTVVLIREGVGAALVMDDRLFDGPMELGNLIVFPESGRMCDCGNLGCLETTGGVYGILDTVGTYTGEHVEGVVEAAALAERADVGPKARDAFAAAGRANAKGLGFLVNIAHPRRIVLYAPAVMVDPDGAAAQAFLTEVEQFRRYCHAVFADTELVVEPLRPFDGSHGAALVALERFFGVRARTARPRR